MRNDQPKVLLAGLGYIGLPTAALIAKGKVNVIGYDVKPEVVEIVNQGKIHIVETDLAGLVREVITTGYLRAVTVPEVADVFVIAVPTPLDKFNKPDISYVFDATRAVIPYLCENNLFIIESTSPVGTTERVAELIFAERPDLKDKLDIAYCPERVLPGQVLYELENNDRVIGGINDKSTNAAIDFYSLFVKADLHRTNARTAEMCKLTENSARDVSIAFANELSVICDKSGIDVWELIALANKHPRINILQPGTGVGGHCIAIDPWFIVSNFPEEAKIIRAAREINNHKPHWVLQKIRDQITLFAKQHNRKPVVALMGLAFKPDIDDLRESPSLEVAETLARSNDADYLFVEPNLNGEVVINGQKSALTAANTAFDEADIVVFLVGHREFFRLNAINYKIELDFCGVRK